MLVISRDVDELKDGRKIQMYYLTMYEYGLNNDNRYTFWNRIKYCWNVLRTGKPYMDSMVIKEEGIRKLTDDLQDLLKEEPEK